ncbi:hypothetical protein OC861_000601 [Tilletia horrida]|nr:hypothetical protein OC861_000601 [Tilletia horrida]
MVLRSAARSVPTCSSCLYQDVLLRSSIGQPRRSAVPVLISSTGSRSQSTSSSATAKLPPIERVQKDLREAMRNVAQPVAIITARLPSLESAEDQVLFHGATISSFTTISMNPPLVAFSLQTPSRIANAIETHPNSALASPGSQPSEERKPHFLINLLSYSQAGSAASFAKPGLLPLRFHSQTSSLQTAASSSATSDQRTINLGAWRSQTTVDNIPSFKGSMSALACRLEFKLDLSQQNSLSYLNNTHQETDPVAAEDQAVVGQGPASSELFIATVCAVEHEPGSSSEPAEPLVYTRHQFYTVARES